MSAKKTKKALKPAVKKAPAQSAAKKRPVVKASPAKKAAAKAPAKKVAVKAPLKKAAVKAPLKKASSKAPAKKAAVKAPAKPKKAEASKPAKKISTAKTVKKTPAVKPQIKKTAAPVTKKTVQAPVSKGKPEAKKPAAPMKPPEPQKPEPKAAAPAPEQPVKRKRGRPPKNPSANPADSQQKRKYNKTQQETNGTGAAQPALEAPADAKPSEEDLITDSIVLELQNQDKSFAFEFAQQMVHQQVKDLRERERTAQKIVLDDKPVSRSEKRKTSQFLKADLAFFKSKLIKLRDELLGQSTNLKSAALEHNDERMQEDDDGTDTHMKLQALGMVGSQNLSIQNIDKALRKIEDGTFGICENCGQLIRRKRLEENPQADMCIECQQEHEKGL